MRHRRVLWRGAVAPTGGFRRCGGVRSLNRRGRGPLVSADSFGFLIVATGDESPLPAPAGAEPLGRRSGKPQAPRRGALVARRDPCKGKSQVPTHPNGCREGRRPFAGCQGSALTGSPEGSALWHHPTVISTTEQAGRRSVLPSMPVKGWTDRGALAKSL